MRHESYVFDYHIPVGARLGQDGAFNMAKGSASRRVNGKNGETMWVEEDELCFKTGGFVERMPKEVVTYMSIVNTEDARRCVKESDLILHGAWTKETPSVGGRSAFLVVKGRAHCWVMEITKNQVPNASSFVDGIMPKPDDEDKLRIPNRVINTPLGGLFTIGSILCVLLAVSLVFTFEQPILGLIAAAAAIAMFVNIK